VAAQPLRTCVGCKGTGSKYGLIRVARTPDGVAVDATGSAAGRGAYVHPDRGCADAALARGSLARVLRTGLSEEAAARLRNDLERLIGAT
jgi:predicted RNA-binding protein YlxR (DUF448 family)